jgi:ABC-type transport system involved in Fe-S cluster assembly fused permease/ATPase subunit
MTENGNKIETILKWVVLVILAVVALKLVFGIFAIAFVVGGFLLTKVLPLVLLVWLVLRAVEWFRGRNHTEVGTVDAEIEADAEADAGY